MNDSIPDQCKHCKKPLPPDHKGPCPYCGRNVKIVNLHAKSATHRRHVTGKLSATGKLTLRRTREYYKNKPKALLLNISIGLIITVIGFSIGGLAGCIVGGVLGVILTIFAPSRREKIREIEAV